MIGVTGVLVAVMIAGLFQPLGTEIKYTADEYFQVRKLFFAAGVLAVLAFMLMLCIGIYMNLSSLNPGNAAGKDIFDSMIKVVPPIMTLVLGYYFGQQSVVKSSAESTREGATQTTRSAGGSDLTGTTKPGEKASAPMKGTSATAAPSAPVAGASDPTR
ncbi:MAG: hypothetical protein KBC73_04825 [Burkholderiaceae bacterium]|nr:hypothetical protein [Burkholderiaceae bacterium]